MAPRRFWKGYLKLSLVTCPVAMMPATSESEKVRFHTLNRETGNRVESHYVDAVTGKPVDEEDEVKGYSAARTTSHARGRGARGGGARKHADHRYRELRAARAIEWIWYDKPHYLTPDDPVGEEAFSVIRDAMAATGMVGISRLVLYRRERAVMLSRATRASCCGRCAMATRCATTRTYFETIGDGEARCEADGARHTADRGADKPWEPEDGRDPVQDGCSRSSRAKKKGEAARRSRSRRPKRRATSSTSWMPCARASARGREGRRVEEAL